MYAGILYCNKNIFRDALVPHARGNDKLNAAYPSHFLRKTLINMKAYQYETLSKLKAN